MKETLNHMSVAIMARQLAQLIEPDNPEAHKEATNPGSRFYQKALQFVTDWRTSNAMPEITLIQHAFDKTLKLDSPATFRKSFKYLVRGGNKETDLDKALLNDEGPLLIVLASYLATQDFLNKTQSGGHIRAWRGFEFPKGQDLPEWAKGSLKRKFDLDLLEETLEDPDAIEQMVTSLRKTGKSSKIKTTPLASYTLNPELAIQFAFGDLQKGETGVFVEAAIPRKLVVSIPGIGFAEPEVGEVVAFDANIPAKVVSVRG